MMMFPATTASPPNFFTPRRRPSVSRPLRDEPPAFLCAMGCVSCSGGDVGDAQHGHVLAMAVLAAAVLPAAFLKDDHLVQAVLRDDGRRHFGAGHGWGAEGHAGLAANGQNIGEGDGGA